MTEIKIRERQLQVNVNDWINKIIKDDSLPKSLRDEAAGFRDTREIIQRERKINSQAS